MQHTNTNRRCLILLLAAVVGGSVIWFCPVVVQCSSEPSALNLGGLASALLWVAVPAVLGAIPGWCTGLLIIFVTHKMGVEANNVVFALAAVASFVVGFAVGVIILFYVWCSMAALDGLSG